MNLGPDYPGISERVEKIFKGINPYKDERGEINNYELPEAVNLIATITSKPKTIRANHFHPVQEQKALVISGKFISVYKDLFVAAPYHYSTLSYVSAHLNSSYQPAYQRNESM